MYFLKSGVLCALPLAFALTLGAAPQRSEAASVCQKVRGVANKGCVRAKDIKKATVRAKHIRSGSVTADKLTAEALARVLAGGRNSIEECGTIGEPGSYVLVRDLPGPLGLNLDGGCLVIEADDVTLDLAGFSIVGNGTGDPVRGDGIYMNGRANVTIRNGTVRDFIGDGISEESDQVSAMKHEVTSIRATGNGATGIFLSGPGHRVTNCLANGNRIDGIRVGDSGFVTGNRASGNGDIGIRTGSDSRVTGNTANVNDDTGIKAGVRSSVAGNRTIDNVDTGILALSGTTLVGNVAIESGVYNIHGCGTCREGGNIAPDV